MTFICGEENSGPFNICKFYLDWKLLARPGLIARLYIRLDCVHGKTLCKYGIVLALPTRPESNSAFFHLDAGL